MSTWTLLAGADVVGEIRDATPDQPWFIGTWRPTDHFQPYQPLFELELSLAESMEDRWSEWEECYQRIRQAMRLQNPDGIEVAEWILHIDGDKAWFRYELRPFSSKPL